MRFELTYDLFCPASSPATIDAHYRAMLEQAEYGEQHGFDAVNLFEHHGVPENYLPSPLVAAAAVAARTRRARLQPMVVVPFYDVIKLAEDLAVIDIISAGRLDPVFAGGYVDEEFEMFARDQARRRQTVDHAVSFIRRAWTEEVTELDGRSVRVTPKPIQRPHPKITIGGMSMAAARAAAAIADDFTGPEKFRAGYREACVGMGRPDPGPGRERTPFIQVSTDPERDWPRAAPYLLSSIARYREWTSKSNKSGRPGTRAYDIQTAEELRASAAYRLVTPEECVQLLTGLGDHTTVSLQPGWGGQDPDIAWSSLELFVGEVMPRLHDRLEATGGTERVRSSEETN
jgi:alkanesulfonate monooxygenase SsuD/methylene tetrahydromethanopterin reductase-like flavin-dependent oxidoreductase (luciferase family)